MLRKNFCFKLSAFAVFNFLFFSSCNTDSTNNPPLATNTSIKIVDKKDNYDTSTSLLFIANSKDNEITIGNPGNAAAVNVKAHFPKSIQDAGISVDATDCEALRSRKTCILKVSTTSQLIPETDFVIQGENTNPINATLTVSEARMCINQNAHCTDSGALALSINDKTTINLKNKSDVDIIELSVDIDPYAKDSVIPQKPLEGYCDEGTLKAGDECKIEIQTLSSPRPTLFPIIIKGANSNPVKIETSVSEANVTGNFSNIDLKVNESIKRNFKNDASIDIQSFKITTNPEDQKCLEIQSISPTFDCTNALRPAGMKFTKDSDSCQFEFKALKACEDNVTINFNAQNISPQYITANTSLTIFDGTFTKIFVPKHDQSLFSVGNTSPVDIQSFKITKDPESEACFSITSANCNDALNGKGMTLVTSTSDRCDFEINGDETCEDKHIILTGTNVKSEAVPISVVTSPGAIGGDFKDKKLMISESQTFTISNSSIPSATLFNFTASVDDETCVELSSSNCSDAPAPKHMTFAQGGTCDFTVKGIGEKNCRTNLIFNAENATQQKIDIAVSKPSFEVINSHPDPVILGETFTITVTPPAGLTANNFNIKTSGDWEKCFVKESSSTCTDTLSPKGCNFDLTPKSSLCPSTPQIIMSGHNFFDKEISDIVISKPILKETGRGDTQGAQVTNFIYKEGNDYFNTTTPNVLTMQLYPPTDIGPVTRIGDGSCSTKNLSFRDALIPAPFNNTMMYLHAFCATSQTAINGTFQCHARQTGTATCPECSNPNQIPLMFNATGPKRPPSDGGDCQRFMDGELRFY